MIPCRFTEVRTAEGSSEANKKIPFEILIQKRRLSSEFFPFREEFTTFLESFQRGFSPNGLNRY